MVRWSDLKNRRSPSTGGLSASERYYLSLDRRRPGSLRLLFAFESPHSQLKRLIEGGGVTRIMCPAMAIRTDSRHPAGMIWSAIGEVADMMGLQIRLTVCSHKRCRQLAAFTIPVGPLQNVLPNGFAAPPK
jgi:hypothetical protein